MRIQRQKRRTALLVPLASMGDIAFLLIIFFVLVSDIKEAEIDSTPPQSPDIQVIEDRPPLSVIVDKGGKAYLHGEQVAVAALEGAVKQELEGTRKKVVLVKIHHELKQEQFGPVFMALSKAGATMNLVGTPEEAGR